MVSYQSQVFDPYARQENHADIKNEPFNIHEAQFLADNEILLVCCRSYYTGTIWKMPSSMVGVSPRNRF
ncbi:MAG: hypothetical protein AAF383_28205 [Cyanobacteria bacterium P01_A01_bin.83]